jgi:hypothetical protein
MGYFSSRKERTMEEKLTLSNDNSGETLNTADAVQETTEEISSEKTEKPLDPASEFEALIKGKFKGEFQKRVQGIIDARFKAEKKVSEEKESALAAGRIYDSLLKEALEVKNEYPDFDLREALKDSRFKNLISKDSIDIRTAYRICNKDMIIASAMARSALVAREKTIEDILSIKRRPSETISGSSFGSKTDITSLTKKERELLCRRAAAGEKITLR